MATQTTNYHLSKPDATDAFSAFRQSYNDNMDIIDANLGGGGGGGDVVDVEVNGVSVLDPVTKVAEVTVPTATSDLTNDSDFVSDASYVHTDNNFTTALKDKLDGIESGAEVNVQADWNEADSTADDFIKNKPSIPSATSDLVNDSGFLTSSDVSAVAMSGDYDDLLNKPSIPSKTSDLTNDSGFITSSALPTKLSDLTNDEGFTATSWNQIVQTGTKIAEIDIDGTTTDIYAPQSGGDSVSWSQLVQSGTKIAEIDINGTITDVYAPIGGTVMDVTVNGTSVVTSGVAAVIVPTKTSDLVNDRGFLDSSDITVTQIQTSGTKIATIDVDGTSTDIYAPSGGGFTALIIITAPTGEIITATKGGDTYTAVETSSGTYEVTVDSMGTWTISDGTNTATVTVSASTTYYVTLITVPDGKTVTPTDDISIWLACGGRSEAYTTLSEVLNDSVCLSALIADSNAVDYLGRSTTWASGITADSSAMSYIGLNNYASNTLLADSTWCEAICNSTYFESVLNVKVPVMTDNTHPSGVCSATSNNANAYRAFDGLTTYSYIPDSNATNNHIRYTFPDEVNIFMMKAIIRRQNNPARELKYQYSADGNVYSDVETFNVPAGTTNYEYKVVAPLTGVGFGLSCADTMYVSGSWILGIWELQFYGRSDI